MGPLGRYHQFVPEFRDLPRDLKAAVKPLLNKSSLLDPMDPVNYLAVLNLLFLGKVAQSVVAKQLQVFLDAFQSSFCLGNGTEKVLVALTDELHGLLLLFELTEAFSMVDYDLMTQHLTDKGICGTALQWFISFSVVGDRGWCFRRDF